MRTTPDYDLALYLASGRQLRAQAFLSGYPVSDQRCRACSAQGDWSSPKRLIPSDSLSDLGGA